MKKYWPEWEIYLLLRLAKEPGEVIGRPSLSLGELAVGYRFDNDTVPLTLTLDAFHKAGLIVLDDIIFHPSYIRNKLNDEQRKRAASLVASSSRSYHGRDTKRDETLGLGPLFTKVNGGEKLTTEELVTLGKSHPEYFSHYLRLKIVSVDQQRIQELMDEYVETFISGDLTTGMATEPYGYEKQRDLFYEAYRRKLGTHGHKQTLKLTEIWVREGTQTSGRFWELALALEKEGYIQIVHFGYQGTYKVTLKGSGRVPSWTFEKSEPFIRFEALDKLRNYQAPPNSDLQRKLAIIAQRLESAQTTVPSLEIKAQKEMADNRDHWGWLDQIQGKYQFGTKIFTQTGKIRKSLFVAMMNLYEKSPQAISVRSLCEMTHLSASRIRIEIDAINTRLERLTGYYFKGSGEGYYTLEKVPNN